MSPNVPRLVYEQEPKFFPMKKAPSNLDAECNFKALLPSPIAKRGQDALPV